MKRKKKSRLWMLQVMLCAICMMSAALLYYDFATMIYKKKHGKTEKADETKKEE